MSHEIRTPLNGVLGFPTSACAIAGIRRRRRRPSARFWPRASICWGDQRHSRFFEDRGGQVRHRADGGLPWRCDPPDLRHARRQHRSQTACAQARHCPDLPPVCISDPLRIGQVLLNILSNAVKFTESGSVALSVVHDAQAVFFAVSDSGIGMNDEQVGQLFTPFHQADASASRRFSGTGLGLAISKRILDLMGGAISVDSRLGVGSTFRFQVPLHLPPAEPGAGQEQAASQAAHDDKPLAGLSIPGGGG